MLNAASSVNLYCLKTIEVQWPIATSPSATSICQYCCGLLVFSAMCCLESLNTQWPIATSTAKM